MTLYIARDKDFFGFSRKKQVKQYIVLDLDSTLINTFDEMESLQRLKIMTDPRLVELRSRTYVLRLEDADSKRGEGSITKLWGITRPHVKEFLIYCFSRFAGVAIWSAGKEKYVEAVVDYLFRNIKKPDLVFSCRQTGPDEEFIWHRDQCDTVNGHIVKPLHRLIEAYGGDMSLSNTFIVDDTESTFRENPENAIFIPRYEPAPTINSISTDDPTLLQLMKWFELPEVKNNTDIRTLKKDNIFTRSLKEYDELLKLSL
jgi:NLI interacting factor-like phosphatase.